MTGEGSYGFAMLGDEEPLTIETDATDCACTELCWECIEAKMTARPKDRISRPII